MKNKPLIIAIDGPGAAGKGTVGRRLAAELGLIYLDTGKIYRAVGYRLMQDGYTVQSATDDSIQFYQAALVVAQSLSAEALQKYQENPELASDAVAQMASLISVNQEVRSSLLEVQRIAAKADEGAILDGRDIGTIVYPNADFKFFITASLEERAKRRYKDLKSRNIAAIYDDVLQDLTERDERDTSRTVAPMKPADDAICFDTTEMSAEEVLANILKTIKNATPDV